MFVNSLLGRYIALAVTFFSLNSFGQIECKEISASVESFNTKLNQQNGSVKIDFKGHTPDSFITYLLGPGDI